jgi:hypothetical protein
MPPQQGDGLLDLFGGAGNFGSHGGCLREAARDVHQ